MLLGIRYFKKSFDGTHQSKRQIAPNKDQIQYV